MADRLPPLEPGTCASCGGKAKALVDGKCYLCLSVISMGCIICRKPIEERPMFAFRDLMSNGYPREPVLTQFLAVHLECLDDAWYAFSFDAVVRDGYDNWECHLAMKRWFGVYEAKAFEAAVREAALDEIRRRAAHLSLRLVSSEARRIDLRTRSKVLERDGFTCRRCGRKAPEVELEVDHVFPVTRGGWRNSSNLQTLCYDCNSGKSNRLPAIHDVFPGLFGGNPA